MAATAAGVDVKERETKWLPFCRRHFLMHFFQRNICNLIHISLKFIPKGLINNRPSLI